MSSESIVLGGGCFWCTEAVFGMLKGVVSVEPGYAGGSKDNPSYEDVVSGDTGHAEVVKVEYEAAVISLETLLTVFFASHDPTSLNKQDNDVGDMYRSVIFYTDPEQQETCVKFIEDINTSSQLGKPIVTIIEPLTDFYPAEDYHKNYYENNKNQGYCQVVINPKLKKVQEQFKELLHEK